MARKRKLANLVISRVDLVDQPANPDATVEIFKRVAKAPMAPHDYRDDGNGECEVCGMTEAAHDEQMSKAAEPQREKEPSVADEKNELEEITAERDALAQTLKQLEDMTPAELAAFIPELEVAKRDPEQDVLKSLPEDVRKRLEDAEERVAKMEADNRRAEYVAKAADAYGKIGEHSEVGQVLAEASQALKPETFERLEKVFASANERIDMSEVLKTVGRDGDGEAETFESRIAKRAAEIKVEGETDAEAQARAVREDPKLAEEWAAQIASRSA